MTSKRKQFEFQIRSRWQLENLIQKKSQYRHLAYETNEKGYVKASRWVDDRYYQISKKKPKRRHLANENAYGRQI